MQKSFETTAHPTPMGNSRANNVSFLFLQFPDIIPVLWGHIDSYSPAFSLLCIIARSTGVKNHMFLWLEIGHFPSKVVGTKKTVLPHTLALLSSIIFLGGFGERCLILSD